jgi:guanylate kinase
MDSQKEEPPSTPEPLIGVVGPCASGKSTLIAGLTRLGYRTRHIAQEHSYVKDMWQRLTNPDILIFLDVAYPTTCQRRKLDWTESDWQEQQHRLSHAKAHADLYLDTNKLSIEEVLNKAIEFIHTRNNRIKNQYKGSHNIRS